MKKYITGKNIINLIGYGAFAFTFLSSNGIETFYDLGNINFGIIGLFLTGTAGYITNIDK